MTDPIQSIFEQIARAATRGDAAGVHAAFAPLEPVLIQLSTSTDPQAARMIAKLRGAKAEGLLQAGDADGAGHEARAAAGFLATTAADAELLNFLAGLSEGAGNALCCHGRLSAALAHYGSAINLREGLREALEFAGHWTPNLRNALASAYNNRGIAGAAQGRFAAALADYGKAIAFGDGLRADLVPGGQWSQALRDDLAAAYNNRGLALRAQGRFHEAEADYRQAIHLREGLRAVLEPKGQWTPELGNALASAYSDCGIVLRDQGLLVEAAANYGQAIAIGEELRAALEPKGAWTLEHRNALARAYNNRGNALRGQGRLPEAVADFGQAIDHGEWMRATLEPAGLWTANMLNALSWAYNNRGVALCDQGRFVEAIADHGQAISIGEGQRAALKLAAQWTPNLSYALASAYTNRGRAFATQLRLAEAALDYGQAISLGEEQRATLELSGHWTSELHNALASAYNNRSAARTLQGQIPEALMDCEQAMSIREGLRAALQPKGYWTLPLRNGLAVAHNNRCPALLLEGRLAESVAEVQQAEELNDPIPDGVLVEADRTRFLVSANLSGLLDHLPDPLAWARAQSQRLAGFLEQVPVTEKAQSHAHEFYSNFALFHARWLAWCVRSGHLEVIAEILSIVQGREIAAEVLDQLHLDDLATPEAVRDFLRIRLELRKLNARIEAVITGGKAGGADGPTGFGRGAQLDTRTWDEAAYNELLVEHRALTARLAEHRAVAAKEPGYESLELPYQRLALADLQQRLAAGEALLLLIDPPEGEAGVLLIRAQGHPNWQALPQLPALAQAVRLFDTGGRALRGYRRGPSLATTAASAPREEQDSLDVESQRLTQTLGPHGERIIATFTKRELFWDTLTEAMQQFFWSALASRLGDTEHLIAITHGDLHLLALDAGQPAELKLSRFPGVAFFAQRRGLYGDWRRPDAARSGAVGFLGFAGDKGDIPLAEQEATVLAQLHRDAGVRVYHPSRYPDPKAEPVGLLHIACHGVEDPDDPKRTALQIAMAPNGTPAGPRLLNHNAIIASPAAPLDLYFSACLGGQTVEGLSGTPSGLVSACLRRNARWVAGALVSIPDRWAMLLALLTHQAMLRDRLSLPDALVEGKRRLVSGIWYADTSARLRVALTPLVAHDVTDFVTALAEERRRYFKDDPSANEEGFWEKCLEPALVGWSEAKRNALRSRLIGAADWTATLADAVMDELCSPQIPPQPDLGILCHGLVVFGEPLI